MAVYKSLTQFVNKIESINVKASVRALNTASKKTNTQFRRALSKDTGLKAKDLNRRLRVKKASSKSLSSFVWLGTRVGVDLSLFKPRVKIVRKNKRKYNGVTVSIPSEGGRQLIPGAFIATVKSGKSLVLTRTTASRYPVKTLKYDVSKAAETHRASLTSYMQNEFNNEYSRQIKLLIK